MRKLALIILLIQVSGCAAYNTDFECGAGQGAGCKSISEVNEMVNNGEIGKKFEPVIIHKINTVFNYKPEVIAKGDHVTRLPEKTMRVWMNRFVDDKGDYVSETYVYTVIEPGKWKE